MTTDTMPPHPRAVTRPRPHKPPGADRRAARVRPYHRYQEHRQNQSAYPAGPVVPMRERAVLERVLVGLRALDGRPAAPPAVQSIAPPALVAVSAGEASPAPPAREASVRSLLGRQLMPLVRAVLARRPEAVLPAERVEPSPDSIRTQPLGVVEVTP